VAPTNHRNELLPVHRAMWPVIHAASQSPEVSQPTRESDATLDRTEPGLVALMWTPHPSRSIRTLTIALTGLSPASSSSWLDR